MGDGVAPFSTVSFPSLTIHGPQPQEALVLLLELHHLPTTNIQNKIAGFSFYLVVFLANPFEKIQVKMDDISPNRSSCTSKTYSEKTNIPPPNFWEFPPKQKWLGFGNCLGQTGDRSCLWSMDFCFPCRFFGVIATVDGSEIRLTSWHI